MTTGALIFAFNNELAADENAGYDENEVLKLAMPLGSNGNDLNVIFSATIYFFKNI